MIRRLFLVIVVAATMSLETAVHAQAPQTQTPRTAAPIDLVGYWVSVVTTEWRYRMMTPPKGDYEGIPMTPAARRIADTWDPARNAAAGETCRPYGAPAIMHVPARLHITWTDDRTLSLEVDEGTQTRLFVFGAPPPATERTWQGRSLADWQLTRPATGAGPPSAFGRSSSLKVVTSGLKAGYIRRNGVPYSENAVLTEYFDVVPGTRGEQWLIVTTQLDDPQYLQQPLLRSVQFRKQPDATGWNPTPCAATW